MNKLLFTISSYRVIGMRRIGGGGGGGGGGGELKERSQRSERGMELPCWFKVGLSFEMRRLSRTRSSSGEEQDDRILKSSREAVWPEWLRWEKMLVSWGLLLVLPVKAETPRCSETRVCRWRTVSLAHIRRGTASTLKRINYTRPQSIGNFVLKHEEIGQT
jgi:hypothetical protein